MRPYYQSNSVTLYHGNTLNVLRYLPAGSIQCCVTSPPYWGLRDYNLPPMIWDDPGDCKHEWSDKRYISNTTPRDHNGAYAFAETRGNETQRKATTLTASTGQFCRLCDAWRGCLGLEPTPELYVKHIVEIFREVRRVLRDDGTLWLNLGDSYWGGKGASGNSKARATADERGYIQSGGTIQINKRPQDGKHDTLKPKDLVGIPWAVSKALQAPYYTGSINNELDKVWLAATIDAEGSICGFHHIRKDDGRERTGIHINITNSSETLLKKASSIFPKSSKHAHQKNGENHLGNKEMWRWHVFSTEGKQKLIAEIYPYLIVKKKQALVAWNFLEYQKKAKHFGHTSQKDEILDLRRWMVETMSKLNQMQPVDLPCWLKEPPSLYEPGWYLRSDIIWSKPNPMPESVKDRPTKAHEYIFLLTKSQKYFYDAEAIKEKSIYPLDNRKERSWKTPAGWDTTVGDGGHGSFHKDGREKGQKRYPTEKIAGIREGSAIYPLRNKRSVWAVATSPFPEAHFATFPPELIKPMILAGCPVCGTVLDPFVGAGTTAIVSHQLDRKCIGIDLSETYLRDIAIPRIEKEIAQMKLFGVK